MTALFFPPEIGRIGPRHATAQLLYINGTGFSHAPKIQKPEIAKAVKDILANRVLSLQIFMQLSSNICKEFRSKSEFMKRFLRKGNYLMCKKKQKLYCTKLTATHLFLLSALLLKELNQSFYHFLTQTLLPHMYNNMSVFRHKRHHC